MADSNENQTNSLINGFKRNDTEVLEAVYRRVFPKVKAHILRYNGDEESAKDIYQEAFITCWRNIKEGRFDGAGNVEGYLFTIARNSWTDHLRSVRFKKTTYTDDVPEETVSMSDDGDEKQSHEDIDRELDIMKAALKQLGGACRDLLMRFYFERRRMEDIAHELGIGAASVRNKKYRCMEQLRALAQNMKNNG